MIWHIASGALSGEATVPGDKSIAHRGLMLAALARGMSELVSMPDGHDVRSTAGCMRALGVDVTWADGLVRVRSDGVLEAPRDDLDAGNSGTTIRLLSGILAGQSFASRIGGDESLGRRPMNRIVEPLRRMGATIATHDGRPPLDITGGALRAIDYALPVASAQVKSCVLLAGLFAEGETVIRETTPSRDHTERMLTAAGVVLGRQDGAIRVTGGQRPERLRLTVPGDISSAAFFLIAAALAGQEVTIGDVGVNPTRTGILDVLQRMGATVTIEHERLEAGEPLATVSVRGQALRPVEISAKEVPRLVDELPLVVLLATQAQGTSNIRGAAELRVKETDRIAAVAGELRRLGARIEELPDGFVVSGPSTLRGTEVDSHGDHRMAMMLAVAGSIAAGDTVVAGAEAAGVSFPGFAEVFRRLGGRLDAV